MNSARTYRGFVRVNGRLYSIDGSNSMAVDSVDGGMIDNIIAQSLDESAMVTELNIDCGSLPDLRTPHLQCLRQLSIKTSSSGVLDIRHLTSLERLNMWVNDDSMDVLLTLPISIKYFAGCNCVISNIAELASLERFTITNSHYEPGVLPLSLTDLSVRFEANEDNHAIECIKSLTNLKKLSLCGRWTVASFDVTPFAWIPSVHCYCIDHTREYTNGVLTKVGFGNASDDSPDTLQEVRLLNNTTYISKAATSLTMDCNNPPEPPNLPIQAYTSYAYYDNDDLYITAYHKTLTKLTMSRLCPAVALCANLKCINLSYYHSGASEAVDIKGLVHLVNLRHLNITHNIRFSADTVNNMSYLSQLSSRMKTICIISARVDGPLPDDIWRLSALKQLTLHYKIRLPDTISRLTNLQNIYLGPEPQEDIDPTMKLPPLPYSACRILESLKMTIYNGAYDDIHPHMVPYITSLIHDCDIDLVRYGHTPESAMRAATYGPCGYDCYCIDHFAQRYATPDSYLSLLNKDLIWSLCDWLQNSGLIHTKLPCT